jgi:GNAT superfamily N-acetyltransferase
MDVKIANTEEAILKCWEAIKELRPHLDAESFVPLVKEMISEGYTLAFIEQDEKAASAIGFRYLQFLFNGKHFYIDDLSTLPQYRGKGFGAKLLDYVAEKAAANGYKIITLDSGYQRNDAHRLYLNKGFTLSSHHFAKKID